MRTWSWLSTRRRRRSWGNQRVLSSGSPQVELLESLILPAGNITAILNRGLLTITGSGSNDQIVLDAAKQGTTIRVSNEAGTVNNQAGFVDLSGGVKNVTVNLGAGDDQLVLTGFTGTKAISKKFTLNCGDGTDVTRLINVQVGGASQANLGNGNDILSIDNSRFAKAFKLDTGNGDDAVLIERQTTNNGNTEFSNKLTAKLGAGSDIVRIGVNGDATRRVTTAKPVTIDGGSEIDEVSVSTNSQVSYAAKNIENTTAASIISIVANLAHDSAPDGTNADGITNDPSVTGTINGYISGSSLVGGFDDTPSTGFVNLSALVAADGSFVLSQSNLLNLFPGKLADGPHTLTLYATDRFGERSDARLVIFNLDTSLPTFSGLGLDSSTDSGIVGDLVTDAGTVILVGQASPGAVVTLVPGSTTATVGASGQFQFTQVPLAVGANPFTFRTVDLAGNASLPAMLTVTRTEAIAQSNLVEDWNHIALEAIRLDDDTPPEASRGLAMLHVAVMDAVAAILNQPRFMVSLSAPEGSSPEAAVIGAASRVLSYLYPAQQARIDAQRTTRLETLPNNSARTAGEVFGQEVAQAVIDLRQGDGWNDFVSYSESPAVGVWQPTAPMYAEALLPQWATLTPFGLLSPDQFRPAGPPDLASQAYADSYNELLQYGGLTGSVRTADQTAIARYWADGGGTYTPPGHWNQVAEEVLKTRNLSLMESARLFAALNVGLADAGITAWDAKYQFNSWRPVDAIQMGSLDGNAGTVEDPNWQPFLLSPPFPEYISGHSTFSGAAAQILTNLLGDQVSFTVPSIGYRDSAGNPIERTFSSFWQAAQEAGQSRIYGGIHFQFSNQDGQLAGRQIGDYVTQLFTVTTDMVAPRILIDLPQNQFVVSTNITLAGKTFDNLSGVNLLEISLDNQSFVPVTFDAEGNFTFTTLFATDGSADGAHSLRFRATDHQGLTSPVVERTITLDTADPAITITSPLSSASLAAGEVLEGSLSGSGSAIVLFCYEFDSSGPVPVAFDSESGQFSQVLDLSNLSTGPHTLTVMAQDAAGHQTTETRTVRLDNLIPFDLTDFTPHDNSTDVGTTFRPQIFFSRPVNPASLNANNFFATNSSGQKLSATIVPSSDGGFAWLFFTDPLPGAATITVHVVGSTLLGADSTPLDADLDGNAGGTATYSFSTVSLTAIPGTSLSGNLLDPGGDLIPMTFDDLGAGPDGSLHTADDVYKLPIQNVHIYIHGLEDEGVFTDSQGNFHFDSVPTGTVKLVIDGRTATNAPNGYYFPEMVMDLELLPVSNNTLMGTMGTTDQRLANLTRPEVYLPRINQSILQAVSPTENTTITVPAVAAANYTPEQREVLALEVPPGSALGPDGQPLTDVRLGLSAVPVELIRDMLPPGLMQLSTTLTLQAPGVTRFAQPLTLTVPNIYLAEPGAQLLFYSYDHDTGLLVFNGTGTVSADGLSVTTDPGSGITIPGWVGVAPPGGVGFCLLSTSADPNSPCDDPAYARLLNENYSQAVKDRLNQLSDRYRLQPLGDQQGGAGGLIKEGLPYANMDEYKVTIPAASLPPGFNPESYLRSWPANMNNVPQPGSPGAGEFQFANKFETLGSTPHLGDVIGITIAPIPGTSVGAYPAEVHVMMTDQGSNYFRLSTLTDVQGSVGGIDITTPHPVSGSREFGFERGSDGSVTFYTRGLDSPTTLAVQTVGGWAQSVGWTGFMKGIAQRFGYTPAEADAMVKHPRARPIKDNPPCHIPPGASMLMIGADVLMLQAEGEPVRDGYYRLDYGTRNDTTFSISTVRGAINGDAGVNVFVPNSVPYTLSVYDVVHDQWGVVSGITENSTSINLGDVFVDLDPGPDSDGDGLGDTAEYIVGSSPLKFSTSNDGVGDGAKLRMGLVPGGGGGALTGVIGTVPLQGTAEDVVVSESVKDGRTIAYVATGEYGLASVDVSQAQHPVLLNEIRLSGNAIRVAVEAKYDLAAVPLGGSLAVVDLTNPRQLQLVNQIPIAVTSVAVFDGIAYAGGGSTLYSIDLITGEILDQQVYSGGVIDDMSIADGYLYVLTSSGFASHTIHQLALTPSLSVPLDSIVITGHPTFGRMHMTAGGGFIYVGAADNDVNQQIPGIEIIAVGSGGMELVGLPSTITAFDIAVTGSGLALYTGADPGLEGNAKVAVLNVRDPARTDQVLALYDTPGVAHAVLIAAGLGFVADGAAGLTLLNFAPVDTQGVAPTILWNASSLDRDLQSAGIQVQEGSTLRLDAQFTDDVLVQRVDVLVDGVNILRDVSFPYDLNLVAPLRSASKTTATLQLRAVDTGGNTTLGELVTLDLVPDIFAPVLITATPREGARPRLVSSLNFNYDEPLDPSRLSLAGMHLTGLGPDGVSGGGDDLIVPLAGFTTRNDNRSLVVFPTTDFPPGEYRFQLDSEIIADRVGNVAHAPATLNFTKRVSVQPINIGNVIADSLDTPDDVARYTFSGIPGQRIGFDGLHFDTSNLTLQLTAPSGAVILQINQFAINDQGFVTLTEAGTYSLVISCVSGASPDFTFRLSDNLTAIPLSLGTTVTGQLPTGAEFQTYRFLGTSNQRVYFDGRTDPAIVPDTDGGWVLFDPANRQLFASFGSLSDHDNEVLLPQDGEYLLVVFGNDTTLHDYSFHTYPVTTSKTSITMGEVVSGNLSVPGENDQFTFTGVAGQQVYLDGLAGTIIDENIRLIGPHSTIFAEANNLDNGPLFLPENGTYTLEIDGVGGATPAYQFRIVDLAASATTLTLDTTVSSSLSPGSSSQFFQFSATANQRIYFDGLNEFGSVPSGNSGGGWKLLGPSGQTLFDSGYNYLTYADYDVTLPVQGTYFLEIYGGVNESDLTFSFRTATPQDSLTSLTLNTSVNADISESGEVDRYSFAGTKGQRVYLDGLGGDPSLYTIRLTGPHATYFTSGPFPDQGPGFLPEDGTYTLEVDGNSASTPTYSFRLVDLDAISTPLVIGTTVNDTLIPGQSLDAFRFTGLAGQELRFDGQTDPLEVGVTDGGWSLIGPGNQMRFNHFGYVAYFDADITLSQTGDYYLIVAGQATGDVNYRFATSILSFTPPPILESMPLSLNSIVQGDISTSDEVDRYTFSGQVGQRIYFDSMDFPLSQLDWNLLAPSGAVIDERSFEGQNHDSDILELAESGTYSLVIQADGGQTPAYSFRVLDLAASSISLSLNTTISGTINPGEATQIYAFAGLQGQTLYFDGRNDSDTDVYDAGGWSLRGPGLESLFNNYGFLTRYDAEVTLPQAGTYYLLIRGTSENAQSYSFRASTIQNTTVPVSFSTTVTGAISTAGERDTYTFSGAAGQRIVVNSLSVAPNSLTWKVLAPSGLLINQQYFAGYGYDSDILILPEPGTYSMVIDAEDVLTASYSFRILDLATNSLPLPLNSTVGGTIDPGGVTQVYQFSGQQGQRIYFDGLNDTETDYEAGGWTLRGPGSEILFNNYGYLTRTDAEVTLPQAATYYLAVYGTSETPHNYSFRTILPTERTQALSLDATVGGDLQHIADVVKYTFSGSPGERIYFDSTTLPQLQATGELISPSGQIVQVISSIAWTYQFAQPYTLSESGTYTLVIKHTDDVPGSYSFSLRNAAQFPLLPLNETTSHVFPAGIANQGYRFEGVAGQSVSIGFDGDLDGSQFCKLYGADNTFMGVVYAYQTASFVLPGTGPYLLVVEGALHEAPYAFSLTTSSAELALTGDNAISGRAVESVSDVDPQLLDLFDAAKAQWTHLTADPQLSAILAAITFRVANLAPGILGSTQGFEIVIDSNGSGHGWFIDPTPDDDREFTNVPAGYDAVGTKIESLEAIDLRTVFAHEIGHVLGLGHELDGIMRDHLGPGLRRDVAPDDLDLVFASRIEN